MAMNQQPTMPVAGTDVAPWRTTHADPLLAAGWQWCATTQPAMSAGRAASAGHGAASARRCPVRLAAAARAISR